MLRLVVRAGALSTVLTGTMGLSSPESSLPTNAICGQPGVNWAHKTKVISAV